MSEQPQVSEAPTKYGLIVKWQGGEQRTFYPDAMEDNGPKGIAVKQGKSEIVIFPQLVLWVERFEVVPPPPPKKTVNVEHA